MVLKRLALLCLIGLSGIILLLAGPRIMTGLELSAAQDTVRRIRSAEEVTVAGVNQAIQSRREAAKWDPGPRAQSELGEMLLTLAALDHPAAEELRPQLAAESLAATRASLLKSPTQPFAWTRYAQALALSTELDRIAGEAGGTVEAVEGTPVDRPLSMAIVTGPWQASLVTTRVEMGLFFWYSLSDFTRRLVAGQIFIAARIAPERLAAVTRRQNALREVMALLLVDDALLQSFTRTYYYTQSIDAQRGAEDAADGQ